MNFQQPRLSTKPMKHGLSRFDKLMEDCVNGTMEQSPETLPQTFGRLIDENPLQWSGEKMDLVNIFAELVEDMLSIEQVNGPAEAGMTFFGQFIDHDITLDATSAIGTRIDPRFIRNVRTPNLDLDCVYGDGPEASPHIYSELEEAKGFLLFGRNDNPLDLARNDRGTALIGDPRNDENILVSQVQGAFICLHNILMTHKMDDAGMARDIATCAQDGLPAEVWSDGIVPALKDFEEVRRFVRLHYQWLVLNRFLPAFCTDEALEMGRRAHLFPEDAAIMPVEFSAAAFRFGHATVQPKYALTRGADPVGLFALEGFKRRTAEGNLDMEMLFDMNGTLAPRARPVGTTVASPLFALPFVTGPIRFKDVNVPVPQSGNLPLRNILRDRFALHVASGQQVAAHVGAPVRAVPETLGQHGIEKTPLWFYALEEAERAGGQLDGAGGAIVAWVLMRLLRLDKTSVLHLPHFTPWAGFGGEDMTMGSLMRFVETHRGSIAHANELKSG